MLKKITVTTLVVLALMNSIPALCQSANTITQPLSESIGTTASPCFTISCSGLCSDSVTKCALSPVFNDSLDFQEFVCNCPTCEKKINMELFGQSVDSLEVPLDAPQLIAYACRYMGMKHDFLTKDLLLDEVRYSVGETTCSLWLNFRLSKQGEESYTDLCVIVIDYTDSTKETPKEVRFLSYESPNGDPRCCGVFGENSAFQGNGGATCGLKTRIVELTTWRTTPHIFKL